MKIIQVNDTCSLIGGSEKTLRKCSLYLAKSGHEVIIAHGEGPENELPETPWRQVCIPALRTCTALGSQKACLAGLSELVQTENPQVLHFRNFSGFRTTERLASQVPVVRTVHTIWGYCPNGMKYIVGRQQSCSRTFGWHCLREYGLNGCAMLHDGTPLARSEWFARLMGCRLAVRSDSRLAGIIVTSGYMRSELTRAGVPGDKIAIIAPPIEINNTDGDCHPPTGRDILFVGRLVLWKGLRALLDVLALLPPDIHLHVAGDGPDRTATEEYAEDLGLTDRTRFHGWVDHEDLGVLYDQCGAVAFPTVAPEAFGNVGPEAMVRGRPVVAFDVGGVHEWLVDGENGYLVPPGDTNAFAQKLQMLLDDPEKAFEMGMAGRERTRRLFSAEEHARQTVAFYEECIERWRLSHCGGKSP